MNPIQAIILGIVEGVTEFLPVSSTFHLVFASKLLGIPQNDFASFFEVFIQAGAILSVFFLYIRELVKDMELSKKVLAAFIPTAIIGFILYKVIKKVFFHTDLLMLGVFIVIGLVFIVFEWLLKKDKVKLAKDINQLTYQQAIIIGLIQALAVIPGVSRAGAVILGMMVLKFKRDEATRFSFMLSIPTIFAASFFDFYKSKSLLFSHNSNISILVIGFVAAFISSFFAVKWFIQYLKTHTLTSFGWYRIIAAALLLLILGKNI